MRNARLTLALVAVAAIGAASSAQAQKTIDEKRPAAKNVLVEIENPAGSVTVKTWDRDEVAVKGTLGAGAKGLELDGDAQRLQIEVEVEDGGNPPASSLDVSVPVGARVSVEGVSTTIDAQGLAGSISAETVSGRIAISGCAEVEAEAVSGAVEIRETQKAVRAESVNGGVTIKGGRGSVEASVVNGKIDVSGEAYSNVRLESVDGAVRFVGGLPAGASLQAQTVSGGVTLTLPAATSADFTVSTMSGAITNGLSEATAKEEMVGKELAFSTGGGGAKVKVETLSGAITLVKN